MSLGNRDDLPATTMTLKQYQRQSLGFSLPEILAIVVILGIFAGLSVPSFLSWVNNNRIKDLASQVEGALKEAQAAAIRTSQQCSLNISVSEITADPPTCLPTGTRDLTLVSGGTSDSAVTLVAENSDTIQFSPKGSTPTSNVFVFFHPNQSQGMRCLAISAGIGIIRTGEFRGSHPPTASQATADDCYPS